MHYCQRAVIFVHTHRDPFFHVQSLLQARESYHGNIEEWFSVKPREYDRLRHEDPVVQVAGQVQYTNASIVREFARMEPRYWLSVKHEDFCRKPQAFYRALVERFAEWGHLVSGDYDGPASFSVHDRVNVDGRMEARIREAIGSVNARIEGNGN